MEWGLNMSNSVSLGPNHAPGTVRLLFRDIQSMGWTGDAYTVLQLFIFRAHELFWKLLKIITYVEKSDIRVVNKIMKTCETVEASPVQPIGCMSRKSSRTVPGA